MVMIPHPQVVVKGDQDPPPFVLSLSQRVDGVFVVVERNGCSQDLMEFAPDVNGNLQANLIALGEAAAEGMSIRNQRTTGKPALWINNPR